MVVGFFCGVGWLFWVLFGGGFRLLGFFGWFGFVFFPNQKHGFTIRLNE